MGQISETDKYLTNQLEDIEKNNKMRTFSSDNLLPSLPLPNLDDTLRVYLESVKPFLTKIELLRTEKCVESFKNGVGEKLHFHLLEKAKNERNWVNFIYY
jgi:carnitine O-octanoyltransferase